MAEAAVHIEPGHLGTGVFHSGACLERWELLADAAMPGPLHHEERHEILLPSSIASVRHPHRCAEPQSGGTAQHKPE